MGNFAIPNPNCKLYALARGNISGFLRQVALIIVHMQEKMVFNLESIFTNQGVWSMALELDLSSEVHITGWRVNPSNFCFNFDPMHSFLD